MALELARYETTKTVLVHQYRCHTLSSIPRQFQVEPIVIINDDWHIRSCRACQPKYAIVVKTKHRMRVRHRNNREIPDRFEIPKHSPVRNQQWPPWGILALDTPAGERQDKWWTDAMCRSNDERLHHWFVWLWSTEHEWDWPITVQKVICAECPVRSECLEQGVWDLEVWGVWGGATFKERQRLRRKWLMEGRVDDRPKPRRGSDVRSPDGSGPAASSGSIGRRAFPREGQGQGASEELLELSVEGAMYGAGSAEWAEGWG